MKHLHSKRGAWSPTYFTWAAMIQRCTNKKRAAWGDYGGRGITVCERWADFTNFLLDMGDRPPDCSLDRIDCNGAYEPANCRWATAAAQSRNRRNTKLVLGDIERILDMSRCGAGSTTVGRLFGVSKTAILAIRAGRLWSKYAPAV